MTDDLLKAAIVGTATLPPPPHGDHPADAAVPELGEDRERGLLLRAGARAAWRLAGYRPVRGAVPPDPSPGEVRPTLPDAAANLFRSTLAGESRVLLPLLLGETAAAGLILPPSLLPEVLTGSHLTGEVRERLPAVVGERGRWLGRLNPEWSWVAGASVDHADHDSLRRVWEEGAPGDRAAALAALRRSQPDEARRRLEEVFPNEKADVRTRLLGVFATGLSDADEPFLEKSLGDRSESTRSVAASLLAKLPGSAFVARMTARADAILSANRGGMLKRTLKLVCTPPQEVEKDWLRDGVPKASPDAAIGPRAAWAGAVLATVPLAHWTARFEASPSRLIEAARGAEFGDSVVAGWTLSAAAREDAADAPWLRPLADYWLAAGKSAKGSRSASGLAEQARRQRYLRVALARLGRPEAETLLAPQLLKGGSEAIVWEVLSDLPKPWSPEFAVAWLNGLSRRFASFRDTHHAWARSIADAPVALPTACLAEAVAVLEPIAGDPQNGYRAFVGRTLELLRLRLAFRDALTSQTPSNG